MIHTVSTPWRLLDTAAVFICLTGMFLFRFCWRVHYIYPALFIVGHTFCAQCSAQHAANNYFLSSLKLSICRLGYCRDCGHAAAQTCDCKRARGSAGAARGTHTDYWYENGLHWAGCNYILSSKLSFGATHRRTLFLEVLWPPALTRFHFIKAILGAS